jgi:hypothetical protein
MELNKSVRVMKMPEEEVLKTYDIRDLAQAYSFALECESYGLDVKIVAPSVPETLLREIYGEEEGEKMVELLKAEIISELEDHESCIPCIQSETKLEHEQNEL